jgi:hypothetical protein
MGAPSTSTISRRGQVARAGTDGGHDRLHEHRHGGEPDEPGERAEGDHDRERLISAVITWT